MFQSDSSPSNDNRSKYQHCTSRARPSLPAFVFTANDMLTTFQQLCFQADESLTKPIWEYSFDPTFGKPGLPNRKVPLNHQAAPYNQLRARRPCLDSLHKTYSLVANYPISYSEHMDEATKKANFLAFCSLAQIIQYKHDDFDEWEREIALEEQVFYERKTLDDQSFFKWLETHDQREIEFKLDRNKMVLHNLDVEKLKKTQELVVRNYAEQTKQIGAAEKRKEFKCSVEAQIKSADHMKQFAKAEEHKASSKTIKPRLESTDPSNTQEAGNPTRNPQARSKEEIQQEFREKMRLAATKCSLKLASPSVSTSTLDSIAPSKSASATPGLPLSAVPSSSKSFAPTQTLLFTSAIPPKTSAGPPSPSTILPVSPSTEETSRDSASSGPASSHSLSTPSTTPPLTRQVSPPKASSATTTPSEPPPQPKSSTSATSAQASTFDSPSKPRSQLPPLPMGSAAPPQPPSSMRYAGPRHRPTPSEWIYPLSLCDHIVSNMPYAPVKFLEAMMPPTEAVFMLPHTSVVHTLASAMNVHPSLLLQQHPLPSQESRPRQAEPEEIEYLIHGLRAWWNAIFPKPQTVEEALARRREREYCEEPLREAFERAGKAEIKFMARRVWELVRERGPGVRVSWEAGEMVRKWLGWERGELGFWD